MTKMAHNSSWSRCRSSMRKAQLFNEHSNKVQIFNLCSSEIFSSWQSFFSRAPISRYTYSGAEGVSSKTNQMCGKEPHTAVRCVDTNSRVRCTDSALRSCQRASGHFYKFCFFCTVFPFIDTQADFRKKHCKRAKKQWICPYLCATSPPRWQQINGRQNVKQC